MSTDASQLAALQAQLAALQAQQQAPALGAWAQAAAQPAPAAITGVSVPVKIDTPMGLLKVQFHLPAEAAASPQALMAAIEALAAAGLRLDTWQQKDNGGSWGGNSGGSWGGNNGGYNRGSYRR